MADRFFTDEPLSPGEFALDGPESHHLGTVRRFAPGDAVVLFNGDGAEYPAEIVSVGKKQVILHVLSRVESNREVPFPIVVGSALPKADRLDYLIEKLVEVGATRFVPLITARSIANPRVDKIDKWRRAVIEASKQCGRNRLMAIDKPMSLKDFLASRPREGSECSKWILHTGPGRTTSNARATDSIFAIGPEGGFTDAEIRSAKQFGWHELSFGPRILRIETAAVIAASWAAQGQ